MAVVAHEALDQFHRTDGAHRLQYYDLHHLEPQEPEKDAMSCRTSMEVIVASNQLDNITHPAIQELLDVKWEQFARRDAVIDFIFDFVFIILWSSLAVIKPDERACYSFPGDGWRVALWIIAIGYTVFLIIQEFHEYFTSKGDFDRWKKWKTDLIETDMKYCHPKWPHEKEWLDMEVDEMKNKKAGYFRDPWNIFDWCVYVLLIICVILHFVDIGVVSDELCYPDNEENNTTNITEPGDDDDDDDDDDDRESAASKIHIRLFAITIIFVWVRLFKSARAFMTLACAFWMMFGGDVEEFETVSETLFSLFRMTLVDEYNYDGLKEENPIMCDILVGTYLAISAIVFLNVFIAMLSETFVRVHDNAHSNALMQRAEIIMALEDNLSDSSKQSFYKYIHDECGPRRKYYDDDMDNEGKDEDLKKATWQIRDQLGQLTDAIHDSAAVDMARSPGDMTAREASQANDIRNLNMELTQLKQNQKEATDRMQANLEQILNILVEVAKKPKD
ncbi:polycystin-2-like [Glandiceps talaboti]